MKLAAIVLLVILAVTACGCIAQAPAVSPATTVTAVSVPFPPDLTGTWKGPTVGYAPSVGFTDYGNTTMSMIISEQKGRNRKAGSLPACLSSGMATAPRLSPSPA